MKFFDEKEYEEIRKRFEKLTEEQKKGIKEMFPEFLECEKTISGVRKSKAEKMFNDLGYEKTHITYKTKPNVRWIRFENKRQRIDFSTKGYQTVGIYILVPELHNAITQQLKEMELIE